MRRIRAFAVLVVALTSLVGCTSAVPNPTPSPDPDELTLADVKWEGGVQNPKLILKTPLRVSEPTIGVIERGQGAAITMGQLVTFDTLVVDGETGAEEQSTFGTPNPTKMILAKSTANTTMLAAMQSAKVGTRFLYAVPMSADGTAPSQQNPDPSATPSPTASKVIAISIRSAEDLPQAAQGRAKAADPALPAVTIGADGAPVLAKPSGSPTGKLASEVLIEGDGPAVADGQTVAVKYFGWLWNGTAFDSVWGEGMPEVLSLSGVISGWRKAIVGRKVGSRVLMVVPPSLGYGGAGKNSIPPDSTLIFLVDIVGAY